MNSTHQASTDTAPKLQGGQAGWFLLGTLGIACVIAGEFAGWNWGLSRGGWGGMLIATLAIAGMYCALVFSVAELASIVPTAGAGYGFARCAFGPAAGFITGIAVAIEYVTAVAVIAIFIQSYFFSLTGMSGWYVPTTCFIVFGALHCLGVGAAMRLMVLFAGIALAGIVLFIAFAVPYARVEALFDIHSPLLHGSRFLPFGLLGLWACIPFALAGFMGVEGIPLASEEARDPEKNVPRGLLFAMSALLLSMLFLLVVAPAVEGSKALGESGSPLVDALMSVHKGNAVLIAKIINLAGLVGLGASFFSAMFAYSRQIFALARAGYLPRMLASTNRHRAPWLAVLLPGGLSYILALTSAGDQLYVLLVFAALVSYLLMFASHIALRIRRPTIHRPYKTPGGLATAFAGSILALISFVSCFLASPLWSLVGVGLLAAFGAYFFVFARHRVSDKAPEEELAIASAAEESFH